MSLLLSRYSLTWRTVSTSFPGQWDLYLLATALLFFFLAYRFDNRFVLSLRFVLTRRIVG